MSQLLISMILVLCPGYDKDAKGEVLTTSCQEHMVNCMINKAGSNAPTEKEFNTCAEYVNAQRRSGAKIHPTTIKNY